MIYHCKASKNLISDLCGVYSKQKGVALWAKLQSSPVFTEIKDVCRLGETSNEIETLNSVADLNVTDSRFSKELALSQKMLSVTMDSKTRWRCQ